MENAKLLQAISQMIDEKLKPVNDRLIKMDEKFETKLTKMDEKFDNRFMGMETRLTNMEVILENDISKKIGVLFDAHQLYQEKFSKLDSIEKTVEDTKDKVDVMFQVIQNHSKEIQELKLAK